MPEAPLGLVHGGELTDFTREVAYPLHLNGRLAAAALVAQKLDPQHPPIKNDEQANAILLSFLQFLLDRNRYVDAATLLWSPTLFSGEPRSVKMIWDELFKNALLMVPGAASMGKSYSLGVWMMLDWIRDPMYTNIQVVGPSERHLERNLFSHLVKLHRASSLPLPGEIRQLEITCDAKNKDSGIMGVIVPIGKRSSGRLQGVKVVQRPKPHPQFGPLSRLRVVLEEAENIPVGIFEDLTNIVSNVRGIDQFKCVAPFNPKDPNSQCAVRCEPVEGWGSLDVESSEVWTSKRGWRVVRLDAYKSENVVQGQEVFFGMQTKEGLEVLIRNAGGVGTPGYYTMARGWYPPQGVDLAVIPQHIMQDVYGRFEYVSTPKPIAGLDVALEGGDNAILCLGKLGLASGWKRTVQKEGQKPTEEYVAFKDEYGNPIHREAVQIDQIFALPKGDTLKLVAEVKRVCRGAGIKGDLLGVDRTGNGAGVHDLLVAQYNASVKGVNPSSSPTERKILEEDQQLPCDEYAYLLSELWFGVRKFIEFGMLKFDPNIPQDPLFSELTGRRFLLAGKKTKVESKKDYKSRGNKSPDRADALTIAVFTARLSLEGTPSAIGSGSREDLDRPPADPLVGVTDTQEYL